VHRVARPFSFLVLALMMVAGMELSAAIATEFLSAQEAELARLLNAEREAIGLPGLAQSDALRTIARRHSQRMMVEGTIFHNENLQQDVESVFPAWQKIGENVGVGPSIPVLHRAFMDSPGHRANIVDPDWGWLGVGGVSGGDRLFVTQDFLELQPGAARPTAAQFRLAGTTRTGTAGILSDFGFAPGSAGGAVIAPADDYYGALVGSALAGAIGGPTLLSDVGALSADARAALDRALPDQGSTVYLVGGPFAEGVAAELRSMGTTVVAVGGADPVATAAAVARTLPTRPTTALIATVRDYPDALAASAVAAVTGWPILYTEPAALNATTGAVIDELGIARTYIIGGTGAVSDAVVADLASAGAPVSARIAGPSRVETAVALADFAIAQGLLDAAHPQVATAYNFPDALAGGALAAVLGSPVLVTTADGLHRATAAWLSAHVNDLDAVYLLGGPAALSTAVETGVAAAVS